MLSILCVVCFALTQPPAYSPGVVPPDGFLGSTLTAKYKLEPKLTYGQRLSGTVTVEAKGLPKPTEGTITWRLLVDGVPQPTNTIDTTQWPKGTHVVSVQALDTGGLSTRNGSVVVVFNNTSTPYEDKAGQALIGGGPHGSTPISLAWGRIDVLDSKPFPLDPELDKTPPAANDTDRNRLVNEKIWWVQGMQHAPSPLFQPLPILVKNRQGDYFIRQYNPESRLGSPTKSLYSQPSVDASPAYDGPRGICFLSPYTTLNADRHHVLASGQTGWLGVDISGRVVQVDITGEVKTLLGPRSVAGVVGTDPYDTKFTLAQRIAAGEKERVGVDNGRPLNGSQDIWVCDSFPFEGVIADTLNNRVVEFHFAEHGSDVFKLMRSWTVPGVISVWGSYDLQQQLRIAWVAAAPDGLWQQVIEVDANGKPTGHGAVSRVADIPKAAWVRCYGLRVFVITTQLAIYEYDPVQKTVTERFPKGSYNPAHPDYVMPFVFANIDEFGSIGPKGRLYWSHPLSKITVNWLDIDTFQHGKLSSAKLLNKQVYGNWVAGSDPFGHYLWGFAPHASLPQFVTCGICSSSWYLWTGCLGQVPVVDPKIPYLGTDQWRLGKFDREIPPSMLFGRNAFGFLGYSADEFRDYKTWSEARQPIMDYLAPVLGSAYTDAEREAVAKQFFMQRTRRRFQ